MNEIIFLIEEDLEGGYVARAIGESIFTQADTIESLRDVIRDAVKCHFEESDRPKLIRLHFVRDEVIASWNSHGILMATNLPKPSTNLATRSSVKLVVIFV